MNARYIFAVFIFLVVLLCVVACATSGGGGGRIVTEERYGDLTRRVMVLQPSKAVHAATLEQKDARVDEPSLLRASTGARQEIDQASVRRSGIVTWSGVGLCVIGATLIVIRGWFPVIPMSASIATIGVGVALLWLPSVIEQYTWLLLVVAGFVGVLYLTGGIDNWIKLNPRPRPHPRPRAETTAAPTAIAPSATPTSIES